MLRRSFPMRFRDVAPGLCVVLLAISGCDPTGEYESRREASLHQVAQRSAVLQHIGEEMAVPDHTSKAASGVTFSIPKIFGNVPDSAGLPGQVWQARIKYEMAETFGDGPLLFLASVPPEQFPDPASLQAKIEEVIKTTSPGAAVAVDPAFQPQAIGGKTPAEMIRMTVTGPQQFFMTGAKKPVAIEKSGLTDIYICQSSKCVVAFVFRSTDPGVEANNFQAVIDATVRTIVAK